MLGRERSASLPLGMRGPGPTCPSGTVPRPTALLGAHENVLMSLKNQKAKHEPCRVRENVFIFNPARIVFVFVPNIVIKHGF